MEENLRAVFYDSEEHRIAKRLFQNAIETKETAIRNQTFMYRIFDSREQSDGSQNTSTLREDLVNKDQLEHK